MKKYKRSILLFVLIFSMILFGYSLNFANENNVNESKIYKNNIEKIENTMREIENYVKINGIKKVYEKYPQYFLRPFFNWELYFFYDQERLGGFIDRTILKYEIVECGQVDKNYKYIKYNLLTRYWVFGEDIFKRDYIKLYTIYLICDNKFEKVINICDDLNTYKIVNELKNFLNSADNVKLYYSLKPCSYKLPYFEYVRVLDSYELELLKEFIDNIKYNGIPGYLKNDNEITTETIRINIKLVIENNNEKIRIYLKKTYEGILSIYFMNMKHNLGTPYLYNNELFFKLYHDYLFYSSQDIELLFWSDHRECKSFPDYMFKSLPAASQEILCQAKQNYIIKNHFIDKIKKVSGYNMKRRNAVCKNAVEDYCEETKKFLCDEPWRLTGHRLLIPYCPSDKKVMYHFDVKDGKIKITCPLHSGKR